MGLSNLEHPHLDSSVLETSGNGTRVLKREKQLV